MMPEKDWLDISTALITPVIAILGIGLGILQWKINQARLQHELFDRRYEIFMTTSEYLFSVVYRSKAEMEDRVHFLKKTRGAFAVFSPSIVSFIEQVHKQSVALDTSIESGNDEAKQEIVMWFGKQLKDVDEIFKDELRING
ncbi:hypothetical protein GCM10011348_36790 [Marinobacterium nitratireducens]|uniref:Uncharacterized protein n=1 Tax=Marinobacterium nitratireducens TaxID=518897 RepID=A0A917ZMN9_9GAMM|nr:hypothetical protein [Marinobacterium nitratireducens]GGO86285.1 hypothetical protein GCM10011348_36790 [Marinobacterium nitratireducens]